MTTPGRNPQEQQIQFCPGAKLQQRGGTVVCLGKVSTLRVIPAEDGSFRTVPEITLFCNPKCSRQVTPEEPKN